jgi:dihydroxyacetone kinase
MVDAVAIGEIFSSPTAKSFHDAMRAANGGAGVACLYGNYAGDNMNVKMAMSMAAEEGIAVKTVVANDDVPSAPKGDEAKRRGVAGEILMWKVGRRQSRAWAARLTKSSLRRIRPSTTHAASASASPRASSRPSATPTSRSKTARWKSASATMVSPALMYVSHGRRLPKWPR